MLTWRIFAFLLGFLIILADLWQINIGGIIIGAIMMLFLPLSRCPRCGELLDTKLGRQHGFDAIPSECTKCGRTRKGVWPLQFLLRPEPYKDDHPK